MRGRVCSCACVCVWERERERERERESKAFTHMWIFKLALFDVNWSPPRTLEGRASFGFDSGFSLFVQQVPMNIKMTKNCENETIRLKVESETIRKNIFETKTSSQFQKRTFWKFTIGRKRLMSLLWDSFHPKHLQLCSGDLIFKLPLWKTKRL